MKAEDLSQLDAQWRARMEALWASHDSMAADAFVREVDALAAQLPASSAVGYFERACVRDSTGHSDLAVPLYEKALSLGLPALERRRAVIQLASSLRNIGRAQAAVDLLQPELAKPSDELDGAVHAFLALALASVGREREALALSLGALSKTLPRYNRSVAAYAEELLTPTQ